MPSRGTKFRTPGYRAWADMKQRCKNPAVRNYHRYGGRGITYCSRWESFDNFHMDMGAPPGKKYSLGRINNDGIYEPTNCRWETPTQQLLNTSQCVFLTFRGVTQTITEWGETTGIKRVTIGTRLKRGWSVEHALTYPPFKTGDRRWHKHSYKGGTT